MYKITLCLFVFFSSSSISDAQINDPKNYLYQGGQYFTGQGFEIRDLYVVNGLITFNKPKQVDSIIDATGKYIVPPYGEAHNHNVAGGEISKKSQQYIKEGIFYVKCPNNLPRWRGGVVRYQWLNTVDVSFSEGGLTVTGGHPGGLVKRNIERKQFNPDEGDGGFIWIIDNETDLEAKWPKILAGKPDFIKTYLLYSEEYEKRKNDPKYDNWKGLNPEILKLIVKKAHDAGLRVSTHIETATDFHYAVFAGVDEINHMPGFRPEPGFEAEAFMIKDEDALEAARKNITVVTTLNDDRGIKIKKEVFPYNLRILKKHNVRIASGSDLHDGTNTKDALYLASLDIFTNLELLKIWCENSVWTIYPNRKIAKIAEGYEANILILNRNPLDNFKNTGDIWLRVKQGVIIPENMVNY